MVAFQIANQQFLRRDPRYEDLHVPEFAVQLKLFQPNQGRSHCLLLRQIHDFQSMPTREQLLLLIQLLHALQKHMEPLLPMQPNHVLTLY